jgi:hypothetical protein
LEEGSGTSPASELHRSTCVTIGHPNFGENFFHAVERIRARRAWGFEGVQPKEWFPFTAASSSLRPLGTFAWITAGVATSTAATPFAARPACSVATPYAAPAPYATRKGSCPAACTRLAPGSRATPLCRQRSGRVYFPERADHHWMLSDLLLCLRSTDLNTNI